MRAAALGRVAGNFLGFQATWLALPSHDKSG